MESTSLKLYENEIFNFLKTLTIKFTPICDRYNDIVEYTRLYPVDRNDPRSWKYYQNLIGNYHVSDEMMTIYSYDTHEVINFTKENLLKHPKTAAAYRVGNDAYDTLCTTYPENVDLIKSIVYPVADIDTAIAADEFTILGYGTGYLESTELDIMLYELEKTISFVTRRWYNTYLSFEKFFYYSFWGILWNELVLCLFVARQKYLHTNNVHSFHIWEYLTSMGIDNYSDILNRQQSLFLYRNMRYLQQNKGKQSNLELLVNSLLGDIGIGIIGKIIYQNTEKAEDECRTIPELVSDTVITRDSESVTQIAPETILETTYRLFAEGYETDNSYDYIDRVERKLGSTSINKLPTKLLEIRQLAHNVRYKRVLDNFILDTIVAMINDEKYITNILFTDTNSGVVVELSTKDALILYYYCVNMSLDNTLTTIPDHHISTSAFRYNINEEELNVPFYFDNVKYTTKDRINIPMFLEDVVYPALTITEIEDFDNTVANLVVPFIRHIRYSLHMGDPIALKALSYIYPKIVRHERYSLNLSQHTTYADWLADKENIQSILSIYNGSSAYLEYYASLADQILKTILPLNNPIFKYYLNTTDDAVTLYARLRKLFIQLCSYNVLFLDTKDDDHQWLLFAKVTGYQNTRDEAQDLTFDPISPFPDITQSDTQSLNLKAGPYLQDVIVDTDEQLKYNVSPGLQIRPTETNDILIDEPIDIIPKIQTTSQNVFVPLSLTGMFIRPTEEEEG